MRVKKIIHDLEEIKSNTRTLECYEDNKLGLDTWVIGMIDLVIEEMKK